MDRFSFVFVFLRYRTQSPRPVPELETLLRAPTGLFPGPVSHFNVYYVAKGVK